MVAQFVVFVFSCAQFSEKISKEIYVKTVNVIIKNQSTTIFHGLLSLKLEMTSKCLKIKMRSKTARLRLLVPLEFWTAFDVISIRFAKFKLQSKNDKS